MKPNRRWILLGLGAALLIAVAWVVASRYFLPEGATRVDEAKPAANESDVLATGAFAGKAGHDASGTVVLLRMGGEYWLRFENYQQTQGPDVFLYLTPSPDPDTRDEIEAGRRILIDGGAGGGEMTKVGNFNQKLPADVDVSLYHGAGVWCQRFGVPFGSAPLDPV